MREPARLWHARVERAQQTLEVGGRALAARARVASGSAVVRERRGHVEGRRKVVDAHEQRARWAWRACRLSGGAAAAGGASRRRRRRAGCRCCCGGGGGASSRAGADGLWQDTPDAEAATLCCV